LRLEVRNSAPAEVEVLDASPQELAMVKDTLTFRDRQTEFLISRHKRNFRWKDAEPIQWQLELDKLKSQLNRSILFEIDGGPGIGLDGYYTYSGLVNDLKLVVPSADVVNKVRYPPAVGIAWDHVPVHEDRVYQTEAEVALLAARHAAIQLPTGSGKSTIIRNLAHKLGLQSIIQSPSASIARQLYDDFVYHFGKKWVGLYGDGKKDLGKKFTIALAQSLTRIERGTPAWNYFEKTQVFFADESHMTPADTFEKVCSGLVRTAPYRFFLSATQTRTDGAEMVLKGITGPVVYEKSFRELVDEGFLSQPFWKMVRVESHGFYHSDDAMKMTQQHLYYSPEVLTKVSTIINGVAKMGQRVLVLVDEMEQFTRLLSMLKVEARFAHGGVTKDNRSKLPEQYWKSDPSALVRAFDGGEFPVLVGTSCISMGTDIRSPETVVYLQGGKSDIQVPQAVGRGTRRGFQYHDGRRKNSFNFVDVCPMVVNNHYNDRSSDPEAPKSIPFKHALARAKMYEKLYPGKLQWL
jgi:superfamily II DNA or RNA helicase